MRMCWVWVLGFKGFVYLDQCYVLVVWIVVFGDGVWLVVELGIEQQFGGVGVEVGNFYQVCFVLFVGEVFYDFDQVVGYVQVVCGGCYYYVVEGVEVVVLLLVEVGEVEYLFVVYGYGVVVVFGDGGGQLGDVEWLDCFGVVIEEFVVVLGEVGDCFQVIGFCWVVVELYVSVVGIVI